MKVSFLKLYFTRRPNERSDTHSERIKREIKAKWLNAVKAKGKVTSENRRCILIRFLLSMMEGGVEASMRHLFFLLCLQLLFILFTEAISNWEEVQTALLIQLPHVRLLGFKMRKYESKCDLTNSTNFWDPWTSGHAHYEHAKTNKTLQQFPWLPTCPVNSVSGLLIICIRKYLEENARDQPYVDK